MSDGAKLGGPAVGETSPKQQEDSHVAGGASPGAGRAAAATQIHRSLKAWRDRQELASSAEHAEDAEADAAQVHRSVADPGAKVFLADEPGKLTGGGRRKLGNLVGMAALTVRAAIKERGGGGSQANMCGQWADKTVAETANAAAAGDALAETAIKMIKQASAKAGDHGGRSG